MSNELKCTGGNWEVDQNLPAVVRISTYARIEQILEVENCNLTEYNKFTDEEAEANAHLIAASKSMYYLLQETHSHLLQLYSSPQNKLSPSQLEETRTQMFNILKLLKKANHHYKP